MRYDKHDIEKLQKCYSLKSLETKEEIAKFDAEQINRYLDALCQQKEKVLNTEFKPVVYLKRHQEYSGKVKYYVGVKILPRVPDAENMYYEIRDVKTFSGKERKAAYEYARKLAEQYNAEIVEEEK